MEGQSDYTRMENQDWSYVTVRGKPTNAGVGAGKSIEKRDPEVNRLAKLDKNEFVKPKQLSPQSRKDLISARLLLKFTQDQLNQKCAFALHTIKGFEANHLTPSGSQLNRLNRELKTSLHLE